MKRIKSSDLPQADRIESVLMAIIAISEGAKTDIEIANKIQGIVGDDRQGRYYRNAAEMLGFVTNQWNNASITAKGKELMNNPVLTNPLFISSVLNLAVYQKLLPYLEIHPNGLLRYEIVKYLEEIADPRIGPSMIPRRISTILAWPRALGFIKKSKDGRFQFINNLSAELPVFEIQDINQPLLPVTGKLAEFQELEERTFKAKSELYYFKDQVKLERAANAHSKLVNIVAQRIRNSGGIPKSNQLIDLAVRFDHDYLFEMKSSNDSNIRSQIRKGISQLYEYRYLQNKNNAKLILVVEKPLSINHSWMLDYMELDRGINLVWDGDDELFGSERTKSDLEFLRLQ
jgi:hypothetical protein